MGARTGTRGAVALLAAANLTLLGSLTAPAVAVVPLAIDGFVAPGERTTALAFVLAAGAVAAVVANPLFGYLSDRTRGRWGSRLPWMASGSLVGLAAVIVLVNAPTLEMLAVSWVVVQAAYNAAAAAVGALFADTVPERHRASASGVFAAATFLGAVPALALIALDPEHLAFIALVMPVVAVVACTAAGLLIRADGAASPVAASAVATGEAMAGRRLFAVVWMQRLVMLFAFSLATSFTLYMVADRMRLDGVHAASVSAATTLIGGLGVVVAAAVAGFWAARRGNYLPFLVAAIVGLAGAAALRAFADGLPALWLAGAVGGASMGVFFAVDLALALRVVPPGRAGEYLGLLNTTETVPQVAAPLLAAAVVTAGRDPVSGADDNYAALYVLASVLALLALAAVPVLRRVARGPLVTPESPPTAPVRPAGG